MISEHELSDLQCTTKHRNLLDHRGTCHVADGGSKDKYEEGREEEEEEEEEEGAIDSTCAQ